MNAIIDHTQMKCYQIRLYDITLLRASYKHACMHVADAIRSSLMLSLLFCPFYPYLSIFAAQELPLSKPRCSIALLLVCCKHGAW